MPITQLHVTRMYADNDNGGVSTITTDTTRQTHFVVSHLGPKKYRIQVFNYPCELIHQNEFSDIEFVEQWLSDEFDVVFIHDEVFNKFVADSEATD